MWIRLFVLAFLVVTARVSYIENGREQEKETNSIWSSHRQEKNFYKTMFLITKFIALNTESAEERKNILLDTATPVNQCNIQIIQPRSIMNVVKVQLQILEDGILYEAYFYETDLQKANIIKLEDIYGKLCRFNQGLKYTTSPFSSDLLVISKVQISLYEKKTIKVPIATQIQTRGQKWEFENILQPKRMLNKQQLQKLESTPLFCQPFNHVSDCIKQSIQPLEPQQRQQAEGDCCGKFVFFVFCIVIGIRIYLIEKEIPKNTVLSKFEQKNTDQFKFTENSVIKKDSSKWVRILTTTSINTRNQFKFKIKNKQKWPIKVGIFNTQKVLKGQESQQFFLYGSDLTLYESSRIYVREGLGYQTGEIVKVIVNVEKSTVTWQVQGLNVFVWRVHDLKKSEWRYAIQMRGSADEVQLIQ